MENDMEPRILSGVPLPDPGPGGAKKYNFERLIVGGDPLFVPFPADKKLRRKYIASVQGSARSWAMYRDEEAKVATRVIKDPSTGQEGIAVWRVA